MDLYVQCCICGNKLNSLHNHIKKVHGISVEEYKKEYGGPLTTREYQGRVEKYMPNKDILSKAMKNLNIEDFSDLMRERGGKVFSKEIVNKGLVITFSTLMAQYELYKQSSQLLGTILRKLNEETWRLDMTEDGKPVTPKELANLAKIAHDEQKNMSNMMKTFLGCAVMDNRTDLEIQNAIQINQQGDKIYSGESEQKFYGVENLPPRTREALRGLIDKIYDTARLEQKNSSPLVIEGNIVNSEDKKEALEIISNEGK